VAFNGGGGLSVVPDDTALVLHHRERGRKVRWGPNRRKEARANASREGRTTAASRWKPKRSDELQRPRPVGRFEGE
jgi:hypothetical protein